MSLLVAFLSRNRPGPTPVLQTPVANADGPVNYTNGSGNSTPLAVKANDQHTSGTVAVLNNNLSGALTTNGETVTINRAGGGATGPETGSYHLYRASDGASSNVANINVVFNAAPPSDDYWSNVVLGLTGAPPVWGCRFANASIIKDEIGSLNGTWNGAVSLVSGLPSESDEATSLGGAVTGSVPDNAAFHVSTLSCMIWFRLPSLPAAGTIGILFAKDLAGVNKDDFAAWVDEVGDIYVQPRGSEWRKLIARISAGEDHCLIVTAGAGGWEFWLKGRWRDAELTQTTGWEDNGQPLQFGTAGFTPYKLIGVLDELAFWNRKLPDANIITLSQVTATPTVGAHSINTSVGNVDILNVTNLADTAFVGRPANLTVQVSFDNASFGSSKTGARGSASVSGTTVTYNGTSGGSETLYVRAIDANGTGASTNWAVTVSAAADAYAGVVTGIANLLSYWRFGDTSTTTLLDSKSGHSGTYTGTPTFSSTRLTWAVADNKAVNFAGNGFGQVAHNAAFATARGTLAVYFKCNSLAATQVLVNKGTGFVLQVLTNGTLRWHIGSIDLDTPAGIIQTGTEYHVAVMWDQISTWLMLDGRMVTWNVNHTSGLTGNSSAWQFARSTGGVNANVVLDEAAFYSRRLTWEEIDIVSEYVRGLGYNPTPETSQEVSSASALRTAMLNNVAPGHHILVAPGTYDFSGGGLGSFTVSASGAKRRPCVIKPRDGVGTATLRDMSCFVTGDWIVFDGFNMPRCHIEPLVSSRYGRVTRVFSNDLLGPEGTPGFENGLTRSLGIFWRFDHIEVTHPGTSGLSTPFAVQVSSDPLEAFGSLYDHIYAHDFAAGGSSSIEVWLVGSTNSDGPRRGNCTFYRNRSQGILSDAEDMSLKSSGALVVEWTTIDATFNSFRNGAYAYFDRCWMEGGWQRVVGPENILIGIQLVNTSMDVYMGNKTIANWATTPGYPQCMRNLFIGVKTSSSTIVLGSTRQASTYPVVDAVLRECGTISRPNPGTNDTGTVITGSGSAPIPYTVATKLSTSAVGRGAADPLVPSGWK